MAAARRRDVQRFVHRRLLACAGAAAAGLHRVNVQEAPCAARLRALPAHACFAPLIRLEQALRQEALPSSYSLAPTRLRGRVHAAAEVALRHEGFILSTTCSNMAQDPCSCCVAHQTTGTALTHQSRPLLCFAARGAQKAAHGSTFEFYMAERRNQQETEEPGQVVNLRAGASCFSAASHHCFCSPLGSSAATPAVQCNCSSWLASCRNNLFYILSHTVEFL